ncbi:MAG: hypothetical protein H3C47_06550 [Candidatus Cloacimonetes bacterium]|nr:hypothetical protein [Candidatus Cloacimonadota bacterium]
MSQNINWGIINDGSTFENLVHSVLTDKKLKHIEVIFFKKLKTHYLQTVDFSYKLRNWVLHEGGAPHHKHLFKNHIDLCLSGSAIESMKQQMQSPDKIENRLWEKACLLDLLGFCNSQIDEMFTKLLNWGTMVAYPEQFVSRNPNGTI